MMNHQVPFAAPRKQLGTSGVWGIPLPSPSLNEGVLGAVEPTDHARLLACEALRVARLAAEKSRMAANAIHADQTLSEGARHLRACEVSFKTTNAASPHIDRARVTVEAAIAALRAKTNGSAVDGSVKSDMLHAEIRSTLASMSGKDRLAAISKSFEEGDDSLVAAALDASRFLTGLTKVEQDHIRELWRRKRMPAECARIELLEKDLEHLQRTGQLLIGWQLKCADQGIVSAARQSADAAKAAIAAATASI